MAHSSRAKQSGRGARLGLVAFGVFLAFYGFALSHEGVFSYKNGYHETLYSPAVLVTGIAAVMLGLLPPSWVAFLAEKGRSRRESKR